MGKYRTLDDEDRELAALVLTSYGYSMPVRGVQFSSKHNKSERVTRELWLATYRAAQLGLETYIVRAIEISIY
jgi:hypothetical protein